MIGQTISHYKILEKLGGGGMGIVYKAQDLKLDRHVALKFLPPELTFDPEAKGRFTHEAKAASALDHNNICNVHEIAETDDGQVFIVMAYYEGETLKSRIAKGKLRIEEATDLAIQIALGLGEAHQHGIVHRDVKPANVLITKSGVVKIVDFGLAKLSGASKLTKTGSTLGTVAYMSPEQLQGSDVDARADIFSLGVVLYEMLTGTTPFRGDHEAALMYSIVHEQPEPLQNHIADVPSELVHIVSRALEKSPADRYRSMDDLLIDLRRLRRDTSQVGLRALSRLTVGRPGLKLILPAFAILAIITVVAVLLFPSTSKMPRINPDWKSRVLPLPVSQTHYPCLSSDGNWAAIAGADTSRLWEIYWMNTASGEVRKIPLDSSENVFVGDISDDGAWILLTRDTPTKDNEICFISSQGGRAQAVSQGLNPKWADKDQRILFYRGATSGVASKSGKFEVCSINRDGSDLRVIYTDTGVPLMLSGSFYPSPDGKSLATIKWGHDYGADVVRYDLDTGKESQVTFTRSYIDEVFWTKNNYIIYSSNQSGNFELWMCPAEGGESIQLTRSSGGELDGHLSSDGKKLLYLERTWPTNVKSVNLATGQITALTSDDFTRVLYDISPDNRFVVTSVPEYSPWPSPQTSRGIQLMDLAKKESSFNLFKDKKLGSPVLGGWSLAWSPDGKWIACVRRADSLEEEMKICVFSPSGPTGLKVIGGGGVDSSGLGPVRLRWVDENTLVWFSFFQKKSWISSIDHPDPRQYYKDSTAAFPIQGGKFVLFRDFRVAGRPWYVDTAPHSGNRTALKRISGVGDQLSLAPSGEFLLYRDGRGDLHKVLLPGGTDQRLPYRVRGLGPITRDGKEMLYREGRMVGKLLLVENPLIWE